MLYAARGDGNIWPTLEAIEKSNHEWVNNNKFVYSEDLRRGYENFLVYFFREHSNGTVEHPLVREQLNEFTQYILKLLDFISIYSETSVEMWSWNFSSNILSRWDNAPNQDRLNSLLAISKELRTNGCQTRSPWENPINTNHVEEEHISILEEAYFEKQHIETICADIFESEPHKLPGSTPSELKMSASISNKPDAEPVTSQPSLTEKAMEYEKRAKECRHYKMLTNDLEEKEIWEMMALRLEEHSYREIYEIIYPNKPIDSKISTHKVDSFRKIRDKGLVLLKAHGLSVDSPMPPESQKKPKAPSKGVTTRLHNTATTKKR
jgi:hypothetical protein